jgi:DNA-binding NarL/FixJ family response regulator
MLDCVSAGVHGYILKTSTPESILHALEAILSGQIYMPPEIANVAGVQAASKVEMARVAEGIPTAFASDDRRFTKRQRDVLAHLAQGRSTKEIARALDLGVGTVKVHLAAIYRHLQAHSRTEAVLLASKLVP